MSREDEARRLSVCRDPQDRALIILGVDTMLRLGTLLDLQRKDRSTDGRWIYIRDSKNGTASEIPLAPDAVASLDAIPDRGQYYFSVFRRAKNPAHWRSSVRQRIELLCRRAGITFGKKDGGPTWHWMTRRTGASRLVERNVPR